MCQLCRKLLKKGFLNIFFFLSFFFKKHIKSCRCLLAVVLRSYPTLGLAHTVGNKLTSAMDQLCNAF